MKIATAGTLESNDCLITVKPLLNERIIEVKSIVEKQFGDEILEVINNTLDELGINHIHLLCDDKGALNYTLKARVITAVERSQKSS